MPVIGCGQCDCINGFIIVNFPEVLLYRHFLAVFLFKISSSNLKKVHVRVAECNHFNIRFCSKVHDLFNMGLAPAIDTQYCYADAVVGTDDAGGTGCRRSCFGHCKCGWGNGGDCSLACGRPDKRSP